MKPFSITILEPKSFEIVFELFTQKASCSCQKLNHFPPASCSCQKAQSFFSSSVVQLLNASFAGYGSETRFMGKRSAPLGRCMFGHIGRVRYWVRRLVRDWSILCRQSNHALSPSACTNERNATQPMSKSLTDAALQHQRQPTSL